MTQDDVIDLAMTAQTRLNTLISAVGEDVRSGAEANIGVNENMPPDMAEMLGFLGLPADLFQSLGGGVFVLEAGGEGFSFGDGDSFHFMEGIIADQLREADGRAGDVPHADERVIPILSLRDPHFRRHTAEMPDASHLMEHELRIVDLWPDTGGDIPPQRRRRRFDLGGISRLLRGGWRFPRA